MDAVIPTAAQAPPPAKRGHMANVFSKTCPSRKVLETLAEKWALMLMHILADGPRRTSQLRRAIEGVSEKMLIQTLRRLERNGFVARRAYNEVPPRVEYSLTPLGRSLADTIRPLDFWVEKNLAEVMQAQAAFDAR